MMSTAESDADLGHELEEGELSNSDVEEGVYIPLERPDNLVAQLNPASIMNMQIQDDNSDESFQDTSSNDDSDSDDAIKKIRIKKPKIKVKHISSQSKVLDGKRSKYSIWCKTLEDDVLSENLNSCEFLRSRDLGIESYDYTVKYRLQNSQNTIKTTINNDKSNDHRPPESPQDRYSLKRSKDDRKNVKLRLGRRQSFECDHNDKGVARDIGNLSVTTESSIEEVAKDLAEKLSEDKDGLVLRVVTIAGKERAIEIFQETKRIEEDGGMMIMNGMRRRTPGGVYLFLVKRDEKLTKDMIREIFQEDRKELSRVKKRAQARHRGKKLQQLKQSLTDSDLPALLTRSEQAVQNSSVGPSDRKDTDRVVSNPPPSPVTDGRDGSSDTDTQRSPQRNLSQIDQSMNANIETNLRADQQKNHDTSYDNDFLDLNCSDDMDLF